MKKLFSGDGPRITVIGGGTGMSVILRGLKRITENLAAVVTMADDGGGSGMLREDLGMLPPGDVRSCLLALADVEHDFGELMQYRFQDGMLAGQNMGNLIIAGLAMMAGSFEKGLEKAHDIFRISGRVIPVTCEEITLCARLSGGTIVRGESNIPNTVLAGEGKIQEVYLEPKNVQTWEDARAAIRQADIIIIGPGSLYTSLIPNLLVGGIGEELTDSEAIKVLVCNVMTQKGETDGFGPLDHVREIEKYMKGSRLDYVFVNNKRVDEETARRYYEDGSVPVILQPGEAELLKRRGLQVIQEDFIDVKMGYVRHNADKIARKVAEIFGNRDLPLLCEIPGECRLATKE